MSEEADFELKLKNEMSAAAREASGDLRQLRQEMGLVADHSNSLDFAMGDLLSEALQEVGQLALEAAKKIAELAYEFGKASLEAASFGQKSVLAIGALTHNAAGAAAEFDAVRTMAQGLGLDVEQTVEGFQKLLAAQFDVGKAKDLIKMGADLRAIGANADEVQRSLLAITQIKSKGRVMAQELLQLQEAGVSGELIFQSLEKAFGKTRDEVRKMMEQGKVDADTGIDAIIEAIKHKTGESELGQAGAQFANTTLEGMVGQLKGGISNAWIDIGEAILPTVQGIAAHISELIGAIAYDPKVQALGQFLLNRFELFGLWIDANWPEIQAAIISGIDAVASAIRFVVDVVDFAAAHWDAIKAVLIGVGVVLGVVALGVAMLLAPVYALGAAVFWVIGKLVELVQWLISIAPSFTDAAKTIGLAIADGLTFGLASKIPEIMGQVSDIGHRIISAARSAVHSFSPSKDMIELGQDIASGLPIGIKKETPKIETAAADMSAASLSGAAAGAGNVRSSQSLNLTLNVSAQPGATEQDGRRLGEGLAPVIRREVLSMFEGAALAAGT